MKTEENKEIGECVQGVPIFTFSLLSIRSILEQKKRGIEIRDKTKKKFKRKSCKKYANFELHQRKGLFKTFEQNLLLYS